MRPISRWGRAKMGRYRAFAEITALRLRVRLRKGGLPLVQGPDFNVLRPNNIDQPDPSN